MLLLRLLVSSPVISRSLANGGIMRKLTNAVLANSGWAASRAEIDSGESRSRHGLYAFPSTGGGFIQMTIVSSAPGLYLWPTDQVNHLSPGRDG
jgi:hypothetical protein